MYFICLSRAKHINVTLALRTTKYLWNDTEYIPWESALRNLDYFILMFDRSEVYGPMQVSTQIQILYIKAPCYHRKLYYYTVE